MYEEIFDNLPYKSSFRFIDHISLLDKDGVTGEYTLKKDSFFYEDHFPGNPVTPGVIIIEIMVQIGLVALGIYLMLHGGEEGNNIKEKGFFPLLTSSDVSFYKMVLPGQRVTVISKKQYFRFGKLKCDVEMMDSTNTLIAKGIFSGIIKKVDVKI
jgi:3-hydroxyacyl-[acyl-carrier-protein] dehydratase